MAYRLPFVPEVFGNYGEIAEENGWRPEVQRGDWYQHLGQNLWTERFVAQKPVVNPSSGRILGWREQWAFRTYAHRSDPVGYGPGTYEFVREDYKHTISSPWGWDDTYPADHKKWMALFQV